MAPITSMHQGYSSLVSDESETSSFIQDSEKTGMRFDLENKSLRSKLRPILPWLVHLVLILAYALFYVHSQRSAEIIEGFNSPTDAPIEYETFQFNNILNSDANPFQGPSNPESDAAWTKLLDVGPGLIWIDEETAEKLPTNTTRRINDDDLEDRSYVGVLEMFHQLHCLDRIRVQFYDHTRNDEHERPEIYKSHTEHCFDYLRQTLMCHGDLNIMSMNWEAEQGMYTAKFDVVKQCRNFGIIKDWTKQHQTRWWPQHGYPSQ